MSNDISDWIDRISLPMPELGKMSVCPYAKGASYTVIETSGIGIEPPTDNFELIVYTLPDYYTVNELSDLAHTYNIKFPNLIFLPDHKDKETFINGVRTNNGKINLILCQGRENLMQAREKLKKTSYYRYWAEDYLKEILSV